MGWRAGERVVCDGCGWWFAHDSSERNPACLKEAGGAVKKVRNWETGGEGRHWAHCPVCLLDMPETLGRSIDPWHFGGPGSKYEGNYGLEAREAHREEFWSPPEPEPEQRSHVGVTPCHSDWQDWSRGMGGRWQDWPVTEARACSGWPAWCDANGGGYGSSSWQGCADKGYGEDEEDKHRWQGWAGNDTAGLCGGGRNDERSSYCVPVGGGERLQSSWGESAWGARFSHVDNSYVRSLPDPRFTLEAIMQQIRSLQRTQSKMERKLAELVDSIPHHD